jgi:hypothetical protein
LLSSSDWIRRHLAANSMGVLGYKALNLMYNAPRHWRTKPGSEWREVVNPDRCSLCGCGVNVGTARWVIENTVPSRDVYEVLIPWQEMADVVVPYATYGKLRAGCVRVVRKVRREELRALADAEASK